MCADITTSTPAAMAARKGTSSRVSSRPQSARMMGSEMCESVSVSPWPGKCFAVASMPASWVPRTAAATKRATVWGSPPNERVLMIGLAALLLTSATGENVMWIPAARPSSAVILPMR